MQDAKIISQLRQTGLNDKEATIYAALLELGGAYPSKIAEYTKLNRSTVYKILEDLAIKSLVNELQKGKKLYYQIEKPDHLVRHAKNKIRVSENRLEHAKKLIPELEGLFSLATHKPKVSFYEGLDGVLQVYSDHVDITEAYEMLGFSNTAAFVELVPVKFKNSYMKTKEKYGVTTRGIVPDTKIDKKYTDIVFKSGLSKKYAPKLRYVPASIYPYEGEVTLYRGNRVSIINFKKNHHIGVIIEDQNIHDMMKMMFELAWIGAKEISKNKKPVKNTTGRKNEQNEQEEL